MTTGVTKKRRRALARCASKRGRGREKALSQTRASEGRLVVTISLTRPRHGTVSKRGPTVT